MAINHIDITLMVDNVVSEGLQAEHGFSMLIRRESESVIFDTGQSDVLFYNADKLGIDLTRPESLVLSHGHYDHTGGLAHLLQINPSLKIYYHPELTTHRYSCHAERPIKDISIAADGQKALEKHDQELVFPSAQPQEIIERIHVSGEVPRLTLFEDTGGPFFLDAENRFPDLIKDDMSLWIETPGGLVVILGCCHSGLINTVEYIREVSGTKQIRGIIGGMHLLYASQERLQKTCEKLKEWSPEFIIPCHCTGKEATEYMRSNFGDIVKSGYAGMTISI